MSRPNKDRIPTKGSEGGLFRAFEGLDIGPLPPGTDSAELASPADDSNRVPEKPSKLGRVVLRKETAHRGGKCVIIVDDFDPSVGDDYIERLSKKLRSACGCGGTVKNRSIEIQGDQAGRIRELLKTEGFRVAGV